MDSSRLFNDSATFRIVAPNGNISTSSQQTLRLLVELKLSSGNNYKELVIQVTDDTDPFYLYSCLLREEDYRTLRQSQGLLVDFAAFPLKLIELVQTCQREVKQEFQRFVLVLKLPTDAKTNESEAVLEVVEINAFKHLCHLALRLSPAPTQHKLNYLADVIKALKAEAASSKDSCQESEQRLREQLRRSQEKLSQISGERDRLRSQLAQKEAEAEEQLSRLTCHEREKFLKAQSDADRRIAREKREIEDRANQRLEALQVKVNSLSTQNAELSDKKHRIEVATRDLQSRVASLEGDLERCRQDLSNVRQHNAQLEGDMRTQTSRLRELEMRGAQLEGELQNRDSALSHTHQALETLQQQKVSLEKTLDERSQKLTKRENSIQMLYAELNKGLDVIKKLQCKLKEEHMLSKVRGTALLEQEKVVLDQNAKLIEVSQELTQLKAQCSTTNADYEKTVRELHDANEKLVEHEKTLRTNENVIGWLNKQLNELEATGSLMRKAPMSEAYLATSFPSRGIGGMGGTKGEGRLMHSTPLMTSLGSVNSALNGKFTDTSDRTVKSVQSHMEFPAIPEEISPRISPPLQEAEKENTIGLDPKYFQPSLPPSVVSVHGLLRPPVPSAPINKITTGQKGSNAGGHKKQNPTKPSAYFVNKR